MATTDIIGSLFGVVPALDPRSAELQARQDALGLGNLFAAAGVNEYATPERQQAYMQKQAAQFALGDLAARKIGGLFGLETPELKRASAIEGTLAELQDELSAEDMQDPTKLYPALIKRLQSAGLNKEAMMVAAKAAPEIRQWQVDQSVITKNTRDKDKRFLAVGKRIYDTEKEQWVANPEGMTADDMNELDTKDKLYAFHAQRYNSTDPSITPEQRAESARILNTLQTPTAEGFVRTFPEQVGTSPEGTTSGGAATMGALPGSKAEKTAVENEKKAVKAVMGRFKDAKNVTKTIEEAKKRVNGWTTSWGGLAQWIPGTDARGLRVLLNEIKADIGFDKLQAMREASPTGGALGQVAVKELEFLQSVEGQLDQLSEPQDVLDALNKIQASYARLMEDLNKTMAEKGLPEQDTGAAPAAGGGQKKRIKWSDL